MNREPASAGRWVGPIALAVVVAVAVVAETWSIYRELAQPASRPAIDFADPARAAAGRAVYEKHCASCHGGKLEGQPDWRTRLASGRLPAPPQDDSGHTWHHPDRVLFGITKDGVKPPYGPPGYASDMPAFDGVLSDDDIWAVLAYIASHWSTKERAYQAQATRDDAARSR